MLFAIKLAAYFATGVMALLAESFHTLSDVFISFTSYKLYEAAIPRLFAPEETMFGNLGWRWR